MMVGETIGYRSLTLRWKKYINNETELDMRLLLLLLLLE
jgi:hypothetical protein